MNAFALRISDNTLVLIDAPEKTGQLDYLEDSPLWNLHQDTLRKEYQSALAKAIEDGIPVEDQERIKLLIIESTNQLDLNKVDTLDGWELQPKPDTPYQLDVEMKIIKDMRPLGTNLPWLPTDGRPSDGSMEYRQLAYLVEPKEEQSEVQAHPVSPPKPKKSSYDFAEWLIKTNKVQINEKLFTKHLGQYHQDFVSEPKEGTFEAESQEELWNELIKECGFYTDPPSVKLSKQALEKFHITRKS